LSKFVVGFVKFIQSSTYYTDSLQILCQDFPLLSDLLTQPSANILQVHLSIEPLTGTLHLSIVKMYD